MTAHRWVTMQGRIRAHRRWTVAGIGRAVAALLLVAMLPATALADDDLPGRVGRVSDFAGHLYLAPEDRASEWAEIGLNYPVISGDNLWVSADGRAEVDYGGGQFRITGDTSLHVSRLDDSQLALFVAQGRAIVRVRVLAPGDTARIDAPNTQVQLARVGLYGIDVTPDRQATIVTVREGEALVALATGAQQVLPGQTLTVTGQDPAIADLRNGLGQDGFDTWSANRDRHYEQSRSAAYVSPEMVGAADLDSYGSWQQYPDYGAVWFPNALPPDWAPYSDGYWTNVGDWGATWVDSAPWGYAPFHYGRWAWVGGRWGWCPGRYVARPFWAPALVAWHGGPDWGLSARFGSPVYAWLPLGWRDPYLPPWRRCSHRCWTQFNQPYGVNVRERPRAPPAHYANSSVPGAITAVAAAGLAGARPVAANRIRVPAQLAASAPVLGAPPSQVPSLSRARSRTPDAGAPPPASTLYPLARSPTGNAAARSGVATPARSTATLGSGAAGISTAPAVRGPQGVPAPSGEAGRTRATPYPVLPPPAGAEPAGPATTPAGGRVVAAPPARREVRPAPQPSTGIPVPAATPPQSVYGVGNGVAAPMVRSAPPPRAESVAPVAVPPSVRAPAPPSAVMAPRPAASTIPQAVPQEAPQRGVAPAGRPAGTPGAAQDAPQGGGQGNPGGPSGPVGGVLNR